MASADTISAGELHRDRQRHLGSEIDTQHGWRVIRDIRRVSDPGAAVVVELATDIENLEALLFWPDRMLKVREDGLERGNCFGIHASQVVNGVYTGSRIVETFRLRDHAHCGLLDHEHGMATVAVVCPVHPYYLADECPEDGPEDLAAVLAAEDLVNDELLDSERRTCRHCRTWARDEEHLTTAGHQAAIERALAHSRTLRALPRAA